MPDIGTLNLTIESNAQQAADGLDQLARKLKSVKSNAEGYDLSSVQTQISNIVNAVKGSEKAVSSLGTLFNSISTYYKTFSKMTANVTINTKPIEDLRIALDNGIKIGQAGTQLSKLREALEGEWNTKNASDAGFALASIAEGAKSLTGTSLATHAKNISAMASAISEYADSIEKLKASATERAKTVSSVTDDMREHLDDVARRQQEWFDKGGFSTGKTMPLNLQFFGRRGTKKSEGQLGMDLDSLEKTTEGLVHVGSAIKEVSDTVSGELAGSFKEVKSEIQTVVSDDAFKPMKESVDSTGESISRIISLIDLMQAKYDIMLRQTEKLGSKLISIGDNPLENRKYVDQMLALVKQSHEIEKLTQVNANATRETSKGSEVVAEALKADKIDNMIARYHAMITSATEAYDAGKLSDERFASTILRIQEFGEKIKKAGGDIDQSANEITRRINALIESLSQPVDYSNLREFIDYMTGVSGRTSIPEDELKQSSAFYTETARNIEALFEILEKPIDYKNLRDIVDEITGVGRAALSAKDSASAFLQGMQGDSELALQIRNLNPELAQLSDMCQESGMGIRDIKDAEEATIGSTFGLADAFAYLKNGIKKMFPTITGLLKRFKSMATMRALRYAIRQIAAGFREGVQNVYEYNKAIGGGFAPAMDSAASALAKMKNSLGAALAPMLQSLIPVLQNIVNWFINMLNYINQFIALLRGQKTWTQAIDQTRKAYDKQTKAAKNASAAVKDLLADWDELNIIQSQNAGGAGGSGTNAAEDYLKMFEEVDKFDKKIRDIVDFIRDNFEVIKTIAEGIGATILLWKLSKAFGQSLSLLQTLQLMAGLTLTIAGIKLSADAGYDIGKNGINGKNAIEAVGGVLSTMIGGGLIGLKYGGVVGGVIGLTVGAAISLAALSIKMKEGYLDSLYGDNSLDVETIRKDVEEKFLNIDAQATIDIVNAKIKDTADAEDKLGEAIANLKKDYPTEVNIDISNKADFLQSVRNLVAATNTLIQFRKDNFKLYAPVSPTFGSEKEFHAAMDKAWEGSANYVESIGNRIGTLLSNGINDSIELTKLKNDLLEISNAVLGGQKRGEFAAKIGIAGGTLRSNNYESFDRETIKNYIQQFNQEGQNYMAQAAAFAAQEQSDRQALVDLLETRKKQGDTTFRQEELDAAKAELEAFDSYKRMMELYEDWTSTGRIVLGQDISKALSTAMEKNTGNDFNLLKNNALAYFGKSGSFDLGVDNFVQTAQRQLYAAIAEGSGMKQEDIKEFLGLSGVNPLDLFDADFANKYMSGLAEALSRTTMTRDEKLSVWEALGLNSEDFTKAVEAVGTGKAASKVDLSTQGKWITEWILELGKNSTLFWDEFWNPKKPNKNPIEEQFKTFLDNAPTMGQFFGKGTIDLNKRQVLNNNDGTFSTENSSTIEIDGKYIVIPTVVDGKQLDIEDAIDHYMNTGEHLGMFDSLKEADTYAQLLHERQEQVYGAKQAVLGYLDSLNNGDIDQGMFDSKIDMLKYKFSEELINSILESIMGQNTGANLLQSAAALLGKGQSANASYGRLGSTGIMDVSPTTINPSNIDRTPSQATGTQEAQAVDYTQLEHTIDNGIDYSQMEVSVKNGATRANEDVVSELRSAVQVLQRILAKPWVVNVTPTSGLGQTVGRAADALGRATGD